MIWFWIIAGLLIAAALAALLRPLMRCAGPSDQSDPILSVFRRQLADIETEIAQGRVAPADAETLRAEITRRMLAAAARESEQSSSAFDAAGDLSWRIGAAVGIAGLLPAAALAIYFTVGMPAAIVSAGPGSQRPHDAAELAAAADQLKARLQREPGNVQGWILLGRTLASLERFREADDAYRRAIVLTPDELGLHAELGEVLVLAARGAVTPEAEAEFAKSGNDPRARFYGAEAALQRGDKTAAAVALRALLAEAPAEAPWRKIVAARLAEIAPEVQQGGGKTAAPPAGPSVQDLAAAQAMSPEQRMAMVRGMVDRLASRLEQNPEDKEGWGRLAHAYEVLGETDKAQAARIRAAGLGPASPAPAAQAPPPAK
jgi:cytochrome c-type biogenesis protein CcmH